MQAGKAADTPEKLNTPGKRALYNNLGKDEALALKIDETRVARDLMRFAAIKPKKMS